MPWSSAAKSENAVRGCFGAAGKNAKKKAKCRRMATEARLWRRGRKMASKRSRKAVKR